MAGSLAQIIGGPRLRRPGGRADKPPAKGPSRPQAPREALPHARTEPCPPKPAVEIIERRPGPPGPPLLPKAAAERFREWMIAWGFLGERPWSGPDGVWAFYEWHCEDEGLTPIPENMLGEALHNIGVPRRQVGDYSTGKRQRIRHYAFMEAEEATGRRKAA